MKMKYKMYDDETSFNDFVHDLKARIRPTSDTGDVLENRIVEIKKIITSSLNKYGATLASQWSHGSRSIHGVIPVTMIESEKIDAVISISVGLYDDLEYPRN